jgi:hypothetical protein
MGGILELIKLIYGSKALSKVLGTRTNVIRLPNDELKQYTKQELNIEAASDKLAQKAKADMKELLADFPRMNDAEKLIFKGNLTRLGNKLGVTEKGSAADVLEFGTGEKVSPEGIMSLTEKAGQKSPPTTLMGKLESRIKQLEASGEDLSKMKGQTYDEFMNDITQGQRTMIKLEDEGLVRATAREIIDKDIKSKKIKLPKEIEADFKQGGGEPIDVFRQFYGEDALEQLNSMVPDFRQMYSSKEAAEAAIKKFKFKFKADRPPGSISIEDAKKAEQEFNIVPADSEEGKVITEKLIGKPKAPVTELVTAEKIILDMKNMDPMDAMKEANKVLKREGKYKNLKEEDVERIMEDTNDFIFGRDIPEDPEGFAKGGRVGMAGGGVSQGLDYLMGIERRGYQEGSDFELFKEAVQAANQGNFRGDMNRLYNEYKYHKGPLGSSDPNSNPFFYAGEDTPKMVQAFSSIYNKSPGYGLNKTSIMGESGGIITEGGLRYRINADGSRTLLDTPTVEEQMVSPDDAMNQYEIETPETDFFSGPAYDKYSKERTDAYANSPSKFDYDIRANEAAGQFIQDKITGSLGDNKLGRFVGDAAALASVPLAIFGSPFHEAAQVVAENRMEPGSGIKGFAKAFMNEQPISTAINRGAGVLQSTALGKGIYNLGGNLYNLKEKLQQRAPANIVENIDTAVSSLNPFQQQRYVNFAIENPDRAIQAAQRDQDFRTSIERRDQKQKGGLSYLLGM